MGTLLEGRTAVVTGAASGIGRQIALTFAEEGADVVVADLQSEPREGGRPTHERIDDDSPGRAAYVECDVTDRDDLEAAVDGAESFGGLDVMVNNAGIYRRKDFFNVTEVDYERMVAVNQRGVFFGSQVAAERMRERGGAIINMSSIAGITGFATSSLYCMTKGGVRLLTYSLADELGEYDIRVNAIHPGTIRTTMTVEDEPHLADEESVAEAEAKIALGRVGSPTDVARTALYLASDLGEYITGESIAVDGGMVNVG